MLQQGQNQATEELARLNRLFGDFKAEWLGEGMFELFAEPSYFPALKTRRPCFLVGGRGTGKTTVLRGLSYEGQLALSKSGISRISEWPFYGFYYRVNTNRVQAFKGPELDDRGWERLFAHYTNLTLCTLVLRFLRWYEGQTQVSNELGEAACKKVSISLHLDQATTNQQLLDGLDLALTYFEAYINNVADGHGPMLSMQGAPIDALLESVLQLSQFRRKPFFFLIDEYENLLDYQQRVLNTLIKHSGDLYTFKIGVKELGWRVRSTLNEHEQLISPADYARIDIGEQLQGSRFNAFALRVCDERLTRISDGLRRSLGIRNLFAGMTEDEEAELLGVRQAAAQTEKQLRREGLGDAEMLEQLRPLQVCLIDYWARHTGQPVAKQFADFIDHRPEWERRYNNYKHVLLYTLHRGRPGIRKYYAGWATLTKVAASNIRYLLQLVYESILEQLLDGETLAVPIPPEKQTRAAQKVGRSNLTELEGLTVHGARLTKLVLGLGRVFGLMAAYPEGHAPEVNQFHLAADKVDDETEREVKELLDAAVQHLALLRSPGTKLADQGDTREYDYFVHPIFAPFFVFSYRRKRKMRLSAADVLGLVSSPKRTIPAVLSRSGRQAGEPLPEQLSLFESYYASDL